VVHVDPTKIQVIHDWLVLTTLIEIHRFLALANFYRRFVLGFYHIAWALSQVTRDGGKSKFVWFLLQKKVIDDFKEHLCSNLVLSLPNFQKPFEIEIYTFDYVVVVVLTKHRHPVAYHSETISDFIHKYINYEK